jgi:L-fuconate dehydratase
MIDYLAISSSIEGCVIEYVDQLHKHFIYPCVMRGGRYMPPLDPGLSIAPRGSAFDRYRH